MSNPAQSLYQKIAALERMGEEFPAVIIVHNLDTQSVEYMSSRGLEFLQTTLPELRAMGPEYHHRFFNPQEMDDYLPRIMQLIHENREDAFVSFFQQVRPHPGIDWEWHLSATRIFMRNEDGTPSHCITLAMPINPEHHITVKVNRLLEENNFLRKYKQVFAALTHREKEILRLMALGTNSADIAARLNISEKTVSTHRRNIKNKLNAQSTYDITRFAQAFDLI
ncbi:helix-turn-helix transcriptional regulator [Chitinophaga barathri]|uniref:LuxR family transcriptional regulator n=1 Tax=Chitinophaga barathri TaxID=1647451 RepID=A0A3N4MBV1_9BACT|nr:helix-turn-helix transcriptional regulator [Chitinophaga barathri]RPD40885.1 LuxR family transcriptional regulator [Chitinophaga barathri]